MKTCIWCLFILCSASLFSQADSMSVLDMSIEELMQVNVVTASGKEESTLDAATTIIAVTPGVEQADSGDDFSKRSLGYRNSLLPQAGPNFMISLNIDL